MTMIFVLVILAVTDVRNEHPALAPLAIGLALTMIHYASIAATGTSVNPARSIGVGLFAGTDAIVQLWLFILAPTLGGALAGLIYPLLFGHGAAPVEGSGLTVRPAAPAAVPGYGAPTSTSSSGTRSDAAGARPAVAPAVPQDVRPASRRSLPAQSTPAAAPAQQAHPAQQARRPRAAAGPPPQQAWPARRRPERTQIRPPGSDRR